MKTLIDLIPNGLETNFIVHKSDKNDPFVGKLFFQESCPSLELQDIYVNKYLCVSDSIFSKFLQSKRVNAMEKLLYMFWYMNNENITLSEFFRKFNMYSDPGEIEWYELQGALIYFYYLNSSEIDIFNIPLETFKMMMSKVGKHNNLIKAPLILDYFMNNKEVQKTLSNDRMYSMYLTPKDFCMMLQDKNYISESFKISTLSNADYTIAANGENIILFSYLMSFLSQELILEIIYDESMQNKKENDLLQTIQPNFEAIEKLTKNRDLLQYPLSVVKELV